MGSTHGDRKARIILFRNSGRPARIHADYWAFPFHDEQTCFPRKRIDERLNRSCNLRRESSGKEMARKESRVTEEEEDSEKGTGISIQPTRPANRKQGH
jgi:hypothetical protein